jgi:hypothetical protein
LAIIQQIKGCDNKKFGKSYENMQASNQGKSKEPISIDFFMSEYYTIF